MWYALIADGDITGFTTIQTDYPLPDGLIISDIITPAEQDAARAWLIAEGVIAAPVVDLPAERERARARVLAYANELTRQITSRYPEAEVASWPRREDEARAVTAGGGADEAPLLAALVAGYNRAGWLVTLTDFAEIVTAKAAAYRQVVAAVEIVRSGVEAAIAAAQTPEAVEAALAAAQAQADAMAAQMELG